MMTTYLDVITGFLGAGKTTFLERYTHHLRETGVSFCIIENEFGRAGVDGAQLRQSGASVRELSGGCVCCALKVPLHALIEELTGKVDRILLEPSGLFCGDDLMDILNTPGCRVRPGMWLGILDPIALPEMNEEDLAVLSSEFMYAGSVLISKSQLCMDNLLHAARKTLSALLPSPAPLVLCGDWNEMLTDEAFAALQRAGMAHRTHERRLFDHASMFSSTTIVFSEPFIYDGACAVLHALLDSRNGRVLRVKGVLSACGGGVFRLNGTPGCESVRYEETQERAALNIIGRNISRSGLRTSIEEAYEQQ